MCISYIFFPGEIKGWEGIPNQDRRGFTTPDNIHPWDQKRFHFLPGRKESWLRLVPLCRFRKSRDGVSVNWQHDTPGAGQNAEAIQGSALICQQDLEINFETTRQVPSIVVLPI